MCGQAEKIRLRQGAHCLGPWIHVGQPQCRRDTAKDKREGRPRKPNVISRFPQLDGNVGGCCNEGQGENSTGRYKVLRKYKGILFHDDDLHEDREVVDLEWSLKRWVLVSQLSTITNDEDSIGPETLGATSSMALCTK